MRSDPYWKVIWTQFRRRRTGVAAVIVFALFCLVAVYAPLLASSKPLVVVYDGTSYFPLFKYLFYRGFYTKRIDIFFNVAIFTLPLAIVAMILFKRQIKIVLASAIVVQMALFLYFALAHSKDPAADVALSHARQEAVKQLDNRGGSWEFELKYMTPYAALNELLRFEQRRRHDKMLQAKYGGAYAQSVRARGEIIPTLWQTELENEKRQVEQLKNRIANSTEASREEAEAKLNAIVKRRQWLESEAKKITFELMPLIRPFHWEDDAGGEQNLNRYLDWWELTRITRKDLTAALIFGIRISLVVGILSITLALLIGIPVGAVAGYFAGKTDIVVARILEIWEAMPTFFMLLLVIAILQNKSVFLVIAVLGLFSWTGFSRFLRAEFFKQRNLNYVQACHAMGFSHRRIIFSHILPNAIPPLLTLLPFSMMIAITSEAGLSFLGLGEEGTSSWGVLMDEGRTAFPGESYLLWPPAILLTILLVSIALIGDALRDALDPKLRK
ncbi:ABC transporter permease [Simkania negevensis]|uniref:Oligopeptide transport system permease protein OppC n=1 Tax=Simkania negevensis TaxID=83561 RepID=A0ABS3ASL9_9BACT|nr:ABC transporter permease [Simkania negevensis]